MCLATVSLTFALITLDFNVFFSSSFFRFAVEHSQASQTDRNEQTERERETKKKRHFLQFILTHCIIISLAICMQTNFTIQLIKIEKKK